MKNISFILPLLFVVTLGFSQNKFPRDTSFNVKSTYKKIHKDFPDVTPVLQFESDQFLSLPNQVYRVRKDRTLKMDVFIPNKDAGKKRPVIMMIHGGGWASGDKSHLVPLAQKLAMDGYVTASVEQRLSPEALYPAAVHDLKEAIRFLKRNCDLYGIDTTKMAVLGTSSGATMASLMATTGSIAKFDDPESVYPGYSAQVQALINMDGVIDFTDPNESAKDSNPDKPSAGARFFGATYKQKPELWIEASAIQYIKDYTLPTLYINSALPRFHAGRDTLLSLLKEKNIYYEVHTIENTPHPYWLFHPWFDEAYVYVRDFMKKVF